MGTTQTEATCRLTVKESDENGDRPLTGDEMAEFVSDFADQLEDDERVIDPVVSGDAGIGMVETVFTLARTISDREMAESGIRSVVGETIEILKSAGQPPPPPPS